jgi:hypothetical protein
MLSKYILIIFSISVFGSSSSTGDGLIEAFLNGGGGEFDGLVGAIFLDGGGGEFDGLVGAIFLDGGGGEFDGLRIPRAYGLRGGAMV